MVDLVTSEGQLLAIYPGSILKLMYTFSKLKVWNDIS